MKLQSLSIIFIIIIFPMILVFTYYLGLQIDTISLQNDYKNSLIDATSDAMSAFEINTANEELSSASDSLRTIVDASTNTFINTLSTSLGMSNANRDNIEPYIPAILYTMYDGYYIYSPTQTPVILEKTTTDANELTTTSEGAATVGEEITKNDIKYYYQENGSLLTTEPSTNNYGSLIYARDTNNDGQIDGYSPEIDNNTLMKTDYVLKSYMPYSGTYMEDELTDLNGNGTTNDRVTIEYTLDNFMTLSGIVNGIYYTKSGYYINENLVTSCSISNWETKGQDELKEECEKGNSISLTLYNGKSIGMEYTSNGKTIEENEKLLENYYKKYQESLKLKMIDEAKINLKEIRKLEINLANNKAITYYLTNTAFSKWVNQNLSFCEGKTMYVTDKAEKYGSDAQILHDFSKDEQKIFINTYDPENEDSIFNNHKYNIIKNSIQYNLNLSMSSYNEMFSGLKFEMPQLSDAEWKQITEKISIVSFLQGIDCGLKNYNGYAVVSSTNNEMTVIPEEIYYIEEKYITDDIGLNDEISYYHRLDCSNLEDLNNYISFVSKEVKYDDIYLGDSTGFYEYDHKNLACYDCIVQNNYNNYDSDNNGEKDKKIKLRAFLGLEEDTEIGTNEKYINLLPNDSNLPKAYYIAVAKERQNLYKTIQHSKNEGIMIDNDVSDYKITWKDNRYKAEITIEVTNIDGVVEDLIVGTSTKKISTSTKSKQTVLIDRNGDNGTYLIDWTNSTGTTAKAGIKIISIKYIYK